MARKAKNSGLGLPRLKIKPETYYSIFFILLIFLSLVSVFSFLQMGTVPTQLNLLLVEYFGSLAIGVPFWLILIAFIFAKIKHPLKQANVFFGFQILFFSLLGLFRQGVLGQKMWLELSSYLETFPTFLVFFSVSIVGFVILFDTSIASIFKFTQKVVSAFIKYTFGRIKKSSLGKSKDNEEVRFVKDEQVKNTQDEAVVGVKPVIKPVNIQIKPKLNTGNQTWEYPSTELFDDNPGTKADRGDVKKNASIIERTLDSFGITARVVEVNNGPSVTQYALEVALGTKLAKIVSLGNDLAMALAAPGGQIRVEAPIPGRSLVGIEVPNRSLEVVPIRKILEDATIRDSKIKIAVPLGLDVSGKARIANIAKMPHVLIAGQTGSGKSVCVNSWISTILFRSSPDEVRMIMVDPKRVELTPYNGIPHLLCPVIVEPERVVSALKWATSEMERRYKLFSEVGAKNIESYQEMAGFQNMPYILIIIDELADIMLFAPSEVEDSIVRIAQMARAVGIHLILATQRPSVDVLTGLIKANIPTRIAFAVSSMTDSRVILDTPGAEKLLGRGDMLYIPPELAKPVRIQGCFLSDKEISRIVDYVKGQRVPDYEDAVLTQSVSVVTNGKRVQIGEGGVSEGKDAVFDQAVKLIQESGKASASLLQRRLKLGYARAARVLDELETAGIIGPSNGAKPREILIPHNTSPEPGI